MERKRVGILIFNQVEILDFAGPFEVFAATRISEENRHQEISPFQTFVVAESSEPIRTAGGLTVLPEYTIANCPPLNLLVVPGGWGTRAEVNNPALIEWIRTQGQQVELLTSVCTGSFLLAKAGFLDDVPATTHWRSLDRMKNEFPTVQLIRDLHVVEHGNVITSAGISAGIDMALRAVYRIYGEAIARATARHMEYPFPESNQRRI